MSKIIIHIGFHKTGSTAIQYSLVKSEKVLKSNGYKFLSANASGNSSNLISVNLNQSKAKVHITDKFYELLKLHDGLDAIISAEHLSFIDDDSELEKLYAACKEHYEEVYVIAYIRNQEKLAISFKQQAAKQPYKGASPSSNLCGHDLDSPLPSLNYTFAKYLNFYEKLQLWMSVFGSNVEFRVYDRDFLKEQCICKDFSQFLALDSPLQSIQVNEGLGKVKTLCKHFLIETKAPQTFIQAFDKLKINDDDYLFEDKVLENFVYKNYFRVSNAALPLSKQAISSLSNKNPIIYEATKQSIPSIVIDLIKQNEGLKCGYYRNLLESYRS